MQWLDAKTTWHDKFARAVELDEAFRKNPNSFSETDIRKAAPEWIENHLTVTIPWLRNLQTDPKLWLRAKCGTGPALAKTLVACKPVAQGIVPDALEYEAFVDLFHTPEFQSGKFEIQDLSSQAVSLLCDPKPGETWWDACAGEGGKTLHLSDLMQNKGLIWATDRSEWRLKTLKRRAARARCFNYRTAEWKQLESLPHKQKCDGVLVDVPCTGVGTWQRNPHARWTLTSGDVTELSDIQLKLLSVCARAVKPGGKLMFAVCTLTKEETVDIVREFATAHPDFTPLPLNDPIRQSAPPSPQVTYCPQDFGGNGMFIAGWSRSPRQ